jgi:hypothetical protein
MSRFVLWLAFAATLAVIAPFAKAQSEPGATRYGGENRGKPLLPIRSNALWKQECGACHLAFAPGLLPAESWRRMMLQLDKHFGVDAALTPQENRAITDFLVRNASNRWRAPTAPLRISESAWFRDKHDDREIAPAVWKRASIKSPANCAACHPGADQGDFEEHRVRIPR